MSFNDDGIPAQGFLFKVAMGIMVIAVSMAAGQPLHAQSHGVPVSGYPNWHERAVLVLSNIVRMAPVDYRDSYMADWSASTGGILQAYSPVDPVYWNLELNQVARSHSDDIGNTPGCAWGHDSCDGTPASTRVNAAYSGNYSGENVAVGIGFDDPRGAVNLWLCETSSGFCATDFNLDGHRAMIMSLTHDEVGAGYAEGINDWDDFWTLDFGRDAAFTAPSPIASATHIFLDDGFITFFLNYFDAGLLAPQSVTLVLDGAQHSMPLDNGQSYRGSYKVALSLAAGCRSYHFIVLDSTGQDWLYPETGDLRTYREAGCTEDYLAGPPFFSDGFESGDTTSWSKTVP